MNYDNPPPDLFSNPLVKRRTFNYLFCYPIVEMAAIANVAAAEFSPSPAIGLPTAAESLLQMAWDSQMKYTDQGRKIYKKTAALLLSWKNSDLNTGEEVSSTLTELLFQTNSSPGGKAQRSV